MDDLINNFVELRLEKELNAFTVKFLAFTPYDNFMEIVNHEYELITKYQLKKCIVDLRLIPTYDIGMPEYVKDVWFPTVSKLGIQNIAFIVPKAALGKISMGRAHGSSEIIADMNVAHFDNFDGGLNWLKER